MRNLIITILLLTAGLTGIKIRAYGQGATFGNPVNIGTLSGTNSNYTDVKNNSPANGYGNELTQNGSDDIFWKFTLTASTQVTISTCGSDFDTYVWLFTSGHTEITHNDDDGQTHCTGYYQSYIQTTLAPGDYIIAVEGWNTSSGNISLDISLPASAPVNTGNNADRNFIRTFTPRTEIADVPALQSLSGDKSQVQTATTYFDGLGRPLQTVQKQGSPNGKDLIAPVEYDQYGREAKKNLSYASATATDGEYKPDALQAGSGVAAFYNPAGSSGTQLANGIPRIPLPYGETDFEPSPLNRPAEQGAPGDSWQLSNSGVPGSGHTVRMAYTTNSANEVVLWKCNTTGNGAYWNNIYYNPGELYKQILTDENGNNSIEYKNKQGHVICKKAQSGSATYVTTSYIYDDYDNLAYVVPPCPVPQSFTEADPVFLNHIYGYHYDNRNRAVEKKIPGKGWEFLVYNTLDQVVYTQDANQRNNHQWSWTKYDIQGRVILTGLENNNTMSRITIQDNYINTQPERWEERTNNRSDGYTVRTHPMAGEENPNIVFLSINYYDGYSIPNNPYSNPTVAISNRTTGLLTASQIKVLNPDGTYGPMLWSVNYYDDKGRMVQAFQQHYLGGNYNTGNYDETAFSYNFSNEVTATMRHHYSAASPGAPALTIGNAYYYDHMGRKKQTWQSVSTGSNPLPAPVILSQLDYNEVGQLYHKKLHSEDYANFIEPITYTYNSRGWLSSLSSAKLNENLYYDTAPFSNISPNFNGNITEAWYNTPNTLDRRFYYKYDALNRLTESRYHTGSTYTGQLDEMISYDDLGNITGLNRGSYAAMPYVYSGTFGYTYTGNQLQAVTNNSNGYRNYTYDDNGNARADGSLNFDYNLVNLPRQVKQGTNPVISYTYNAAGQKLRKQSGQTGTTEYINGIQYTNGTIDFLQTEEGRYLIAGGKYQYDLKDHLGNVRVMIEKATPNSSTLMQENEYYAFGLNVNRTNVSPDNKYLYNGKEIQDDYNLNQLDYGARYYDPILARWTTPDPLANFGRRWSPYNYALDNPIRYVDPDGMYSTEDWKKDNNIKDDDLVNIYTAPEETKEKDKSPPNSNWQPLYKSTLLSYVQNTSCNNCSPGTLQNKTGAVFEDLFEEYIDENFNLDNFRVIKNPLNNKLPGEVDYTVPDFLGLKYEVGRKTGAELYAFYELENFYELKATKNNIGLGSFDGQLKVQIQAAKKLKVSQIVLVTTYGVKLSNQLLKYAQNNGVGITHYWTQYQMVNGQMKTNYTPSTQ